MPSEALTAFLRAHRDWWHPRPFVGEALPWEEAHPALGAWLDEQPAGAPLDFDRAPSVLRDLAREAAHLSALPRSTAPVFAPEARAVRGVPGRKVKQIQGFAAVVKSQRLADGADRVLDWCAGKGHLGRTLAAAAELPLHAIEIDPALCRAGEALCAARGVPATFHAADALVSADLVAPGALAVALHACGDLHAALLRAATTRRPAALALAPCCYNRAAPEDVVLSQAARAAGLDFTESDLDLLHRTVAVAGPAERERLARTLAWRQGFDLWRRAITGEATYRPMPPFPPAWLRLDFAEFACRFAVLGGLPQVPGPEVAAFEAPGHRRALAIGRRDAVRGLFARPLEVWFVQDRVQFLRESGYTVNASTFCASDETPRNVLLTARRG